MVAWSVRSDWRRLNVAEAARRGRHLIVKNAQYITYNTPYSLSGSFIRDAPLFLLSFQASAVLTGHFALARMVSMAPAILASSSVSLVFFREAALHRGTSYLQLLTTRVPGVSIQLHLPYHRLEQLHQPHQHRFLRLAG